jgi:catechol 2,3-dioxygenase-like lactoylglutathione lyase family enzyme
MEIKGLFKSNRAVEINVTDIAKAKEFYGNVMRFKLIVEKENQLVFETGNFVLYVDKGVSACLPVPSYTVKNFTEAKELLLNNGCSIVREGKNWLWFKDPFGMIYDIIKQ